MTARLSVQLSCNAVGCGHRRVVELDATAIDDGASPSWPNWWGLAATLEARGRRIAASDAGWSTATNASGSLLDFCSSHRRR